LAVTECAARFSLKQTQQCIGLNDGFQILPLGFGKRPFGSLFGGSS
jgi:hypothetical protein